MPMLSMRPSPESIFVCMRRASTPSRAKMLCISSASRAAAHSNASSKADRSGMRGTTDCFAAALLPRGPAMPEQRTDHAIRKCDCWGVRGRAHLKQVAALAWARVRCERYGWRTLKTRACRTRARGARLRIDDHLCGARIDRRARVDGALQRVGTIEVCAQHRAHLRANARLDP